MSADAEPAAVGTGLREVAAEEAVLSEVIGALAPLERRAGDPGEERAAHWIAERLRAAGAAADVEAEQFYDGYARVISPLAGASLAAGTAALATRGRTRRAAGMLAAAVTGLVADDISNGPRLARRVIAARKTTWNVVGRAGDPGAARTLVVLAHHDAAPTGAIFDDRFQAWLGERFPGILERIDTSLPLWWAMLAGPGLVGLGALRGRRGMIGAGVVASAVGVAAFEDIARSPIVPGANDNLTAVAALVALAERLRAEPVPGLRVLLVSCGAEEVVQGGIYGFAARHFPVLERERTWFLNLETVGSPKLMMLEGEGPVIMEDYFDRDFRDLVARCAERAGVPMRRGMRARNSTDAVIPSRAGYPTTTLASMDRYKALSHYHQLSDTPENVDLRTVRAAVTVTEAVARELAVNPWL